MNKTAIVIGATGLVGSSLLEQLLEDAHFDEVKVFHRRTSGLKNPKLKSKIFYSRMKGELDEAVQKLPFRNIVIMRPSILAGNRNEKRSGEQIGLALAKVFTRIPGLRKYRPIHGKELAAAMIRAFEIKQEEKIRIYTLDEIFSLLAPGV